MTSRTDPDQDADNPTSDIINIKIQIDEENAELISYDLVSERQQSRVAGTVHAELIYDTLENCHVFDKHGITRMDNGESLLEFHIYNNQDPETKIIPGMKWGHRLVPSTLGTLFLVDNKVYLPYTQVSYILHSVDFMGSAGLQALDQLIFYPKDYYKIKGQSTLHKFKYDTNVLERILDCYWRMDKRYCLSPLVRSQTFKALDKEAFKSFKTSQSQIGQKPVLEESKSAAANQSDDVRATVTNKVSKLGQRMGGLKGKINQALTGREIVTTYTDDDKMILDYLVEISHDKLINQILYMLSKLPISLSFKLTQPQFSELLGYSRFPDYLNTWFEQTTQLEKVRLLLTPPDETMKEFRSNMRVLNANFFQEYPTST